MKKENPMINEERIFIGLTVFITICLSPILLKILGVISWGWGAACSLLAILGTYIVIALFYLLVYFLLFYRGNK